MTRTHRRRRRWTREGLPGHRQLHPGLRGGLFLSLTLALAVVGFGIWTGWLRIAAGLPPQEVLPRLSVLTIYVLMILAALAATRLCARLLDGEPRPDLGLPLAGCPLAHGLLGIVAGLAAQGAADLAGLLTAAYTAQPNAGPGPAFWRYVLTSLIGVPLAVLVLWPAARPAYRPSAARAAR